MKKEKIPREEGGGINFEFKRREVEEILVNHLIGKGEEIPKEEVDLKFYFCGGEAALVITGKETKSSEDSREDDIPF
jgi:hypothetical protein